MTELPAPDPQTMAPWKDLLDASAAQNGGRHLLLVQLDGAVVIDGMTDSVEQIRLLTQVLAGVLHRTGADDQAAAIHAATHPWLTAAETVRNQTHTEREVS